MKNSSLRTVYDILTGKEVSDEVRQAVVEELEAEFAKKAEKAQANRDLYASAHDPAINALTDEPMTMADWYDACADELPEGFSKSKMQYAIRVYWADEVAKIEGKVNMYKRA